MLPRFKVDFHVICITYYCPFFWISPSIFPFFHFLYTDNVFGKQQLFLRAQLYVEVTVRESIQHGFIDEPDSNLVAAECNG